MKWFFGVFQSICFQCNYAILICDGLISIYSFSTSSISSDISICPEEPADTHHFGLKQENFEKSWLLDTLF